MAGEGSENAPAAPVEQLENLQLDEVTGEKVCTHATRISSRVVGSSPRLLADLQVGAQEEAEAAPEG